MKDFKINFIKITPYIFVTLIAICSFKILMTLHLPNVDTLTNSAISVIDGRPQWKAFQNRLLGPYSIYGISNIIGVSFRTAWFIYNAITLQIFCVLIFWILRNEGFSLKDAFTYLVVLLFAFLTLQNPWLYAWDNLDLIIFTCFTYGIIKSYSFSFFLVIFFIGVLNRESALFISVYLMLNAFKFSKGGLPIKLTNYKSLISGLVMLVCGIIYTQFIRNLFFLSNTEGKPDLDHELIGNHIYFLGNLENIFFTNFTNHHFLITILIFSLFAYFIRNFRSMYDREIKLLIMSLFIFVNILIFGVFNETRMHFILLPFFLFLWICLNDKILNKQQTKKLTKL